jgi:hypothetical protein
VLGYITQGFRGCAVGYFKLHSSFVFIESKRQRIPFAGQQRGMLRCHASYVVSKTSLLPNADYHPSQQYVSAITRWDRVCTIASLNRVSLFSLCQKGTRLCQLQTYHTTVTGDRTITAPFRSIRYDLVTVTRLMVLAIR